MTEVINPNLNKDKIYSLSSLKSELEWLKQQWEKMKKEMLWISHWISEDDTWNYKKLQEMTKKLQDSEKKLQNFINEMGWASIDISSIQEQISSLKQEMLRKISPKDRYKFLEEIMQWKTKINPIKNLKWKSKEAVNEVLRKWPNNISAGDVYMMKKEGVDLAQVFLLSEDGKQVSKENIQKWQSFITNFWKNKDVNNTIGAWDILPIDKISRVKINGVEWVRGYIPRPWYYIADSQGKPTWDYIRIYDGYTIEILDEKPLEQNEKDDFLQAENYRYEKIRTWDIENIIREARSSDTEIKIDYKSPADLKILSDLFTTKYNGEIEVDKDKIKTKNGKTFGQIYEWKIEFDKDYNESYEWKWWPFVSMSDAQADREKWKNSYWCAYIARMNAKNQFEINLQSGDADVAMNSYNNWAIDNSYKWKSQQLDFLNTPWVDFVDLFYTWKGKVWKMLEKRGGAWHRVVGYKWGWEWFVIDAYANKWKPIPLTRYAQATGRKMVRAAFFDSSRISPEQSDKAEIIARTKLEKSEAFMEKLRNICSEIGCSTNNMLTVMQAESWISTSKENPKGAIGLIQFMPNTAKALGTSKEALAKMSWIEQLDYVRKYYLPYKWKLKRIEDLYLVTFHPASLNKSEDTRIGVDIWKWTDNNPDYLKIYKQNPAIAEFAWGKWYITVGDFYEYVQAKKLNHI